MIPIKYLKIISGGQTGVDRAALDVAIALGFDYGGWCPQGGLAEDMPDPPGLLSPYPALRETQAADYFERTRLNVEDSDATLIIAPNEMLATTGGTGYTIQHADNKQKPCLVVLLKEMNPTKQVVQQAALWLNNLIQQLNDSSSAAKKIILNVAGPRVSKVPDIYQQTYTFLKTLFHAET